MLRPVCILTSRGLWLVVCLCSWNVSQQRAGTSCMRFPEDLIYPASSGHAGHGMFAGRLTTDRRTQAELMRHYLLLLGVP